MSEQAVHYVRVCEGELLPEIQHLAPFKAVVALDGPYSPLWQNAVSDWLVRSGCLYMMAWGEDCSSWDDSVDWASLEQTNFEEVPKEGWVMTTWHEDDTLDGVFWFAGHAARHWSVELPTTVILHVSRTDRAEEMKNRFCAAQTADLGG